jgi:predicted  nucleic acid-binding Zn-ribbon protein
LRDELGWDDERADTPYSEIQKVHQCDNELTEEEHWTKIDPGRALPFPIRKCHPLISSKSPITPDPYVCAMTESIADLSGAGALSRAGRPARAHRGSHETRDQLSELQRRHQNATIALAERESLFSKVLKDGGIDAAVISDFIRSAHRADELQSQLRDAQAALDLATAKVTGLEGQREQQRQLEQQLRREITALTSKLADSRASSPKSARQIAALQHQISQLKNECATMEQANAKLTIEILDLQGRLTNYTNEEALADSSTARLRAQVQALQARVAQNETEKQKLHSQIEFALSEHERTRGELRRMQRDIGDVARAVQGRAEAFGLTIGKAHADIAGRLNSADRKLREGRRTTARMKTETAGAARQNYRAIQRLAQLCARLSGLRTDIIPRPEELAGPGLDSFAGRVETSADVRELAHKSDTRKLEQKVEAAKRKSVSASVEQAVRGVREVIGTLTTQLHNDHRQLIHRIGEHG